MHAITMYIDPINGENDYLTVVLAVTATADVYMVT